MPRADRARLRATSRRWMVSALSDHLGYKAAALFLSLVLWLAVSAEQPTEMTVPVSLQLDLDSSLVLAEPPPRLQAVVAGQARDVTRLLSDPPEVRRSFPPDVGDSVRFELVPSDVLPPPGLDGDVSVRRVEPSVITLRLTTRVSRRVPLRSRVRVVVDSALRATGPATLVPDSVTVTGTRERVEAVDVVYTEAVDVRVRDTLGVVVPLDTTGLGVQVRPARARVRVPLARDTLFSLPAILPWTRPAVRAP